MQLDKVGRLRAWLKQFTPEPVDRRSWAYPTRPPFNDPGWMLKKPLEPKKAALVDGEQLTEEKAILMLAVADIYKLDPNMRYVFWFDRMLNPQHIEMIRRILDRVGIKCAIVTGVVEPKIYEFKKDEEEKASA